MLAAIFLGVCNAAALLGVLGHMMEPPMDPELRRRQKIYQQMKKNMLLGESCATAST